jgi:hypothetical protein
MLRAEPSRPDRVRRALDRVIPRFERALHGSALRDLRMQSRRGFTSVRRGSRVLVRFGLVGDVLVAGQASRGDLARLARRPAPRVHEAHGGLSFTIPASALQRLAPLPALPVSGWARGATDALDVSASMPLLQR